MKSYIPLLVACALLMPGTLVAQSTAFTYQGRLNAGDSPANGLYEVSFTLYDAVTNGNIVGTPATVAPLPVTNGLFTATLDFGAGAFLGADRWLEIAVTVFSSDQPVVTLVPRQPIAPTPYALHAHNAAGLMSFTEAPVEIKVNGERALRLEPTHIFDDTTVGAPNLIGGSSANFVGWGVTGATIGGGGAVSYFGQNGRNAIDSSFGTISGGRSNTISTQAGAATIAGGEGNFTEGEGSAIGGGRENRVSGDGGTIGGGWGNTAGTYATIGGGLHNTNYHRAATISGGEVNVGRGSWTVIAGGIFNRTDSDFATVGGGGQNTSSGESATVGGGAFNLSSGRRATVAGGLQNTSSGEFAAIGGGRDNRGEGTAATVAGGVYNKSTGEFTTIGGGLFNTAAHLAGTVGGGQSNQIAAAFATIDGGSGNRITENDIALGVPPAEYAVIGGGRDNIVQGQGSTIAGGQFNFIEIGEDESGGDCVIGGGGGNRTKGDILTIAGGAGNRAAGFGATIGGGLSNQADGWISFIGGGELNVTTGDFAIVPGGQACHATGGFSFAAGRQARANHRGAFVWADAAGPQDYPSFPFESATTNEFAVRATGGVRFVSAIDTNGSNIAGVSLAPGSGAWSSLSDRNAKENFATANAREILDKVAALPMASWNYKAQGAAVRHLGPMAQDFHAAFGLGESERTITSVDADGVALAAIQGLNAKLETELKAKDARIAELERRLAGIEKLIGAAPVK